MTEPSSPARELRRGVSPVQDPQAEQLRRARIAERIVTVNRQLAERDARSGRHGWWFAAAALLGSLCLVWWLGREPATTALGADVQLISGAASLSRDGTLAPLGDSPLDVSRAEPILVTRADQTAELRLSSNAALRVEAASEVGLRRRQISSGFEERVRLRAGSIALRVPKLGPSSHLAVQTDDSWIEVHGTQFSVRWVEQPPLQPFTEVRVKEGKVLVRARDGAQRFLGPGEEWRSSETAVAPPASVPALAPPAPAAAPEPAPRAEPRLVPRPRASSAAEPASEVPAPAVSASELGAQNHLLDGAELARKSGMPALALQRLEALIARYPDAELAHNARVQRLRLLGRMGRRAQALAAADDYLQRYPNGFARAEAQAMVNVAQPPRDAKGTLEAAEPAGARP